MDIDKVKKGDEVEVKEAFGYRFCGRMSPVLPGTYIVGVDVTLDVIKQAEEAGALKKAAKPKANSKAE